jgi:hypothetical protein
MADMTGNTQVRRRGIAGLIVAPLAWALHHQVGSNWSFAACARDPGVVSMVVGAAAVAAMLVAAFLAWREWRRVGGSWTENAETLARFVPLLSLMACLAFGLPVLAQLMATVLLPPCFG